MIKLAAKNILRVFCVVKRSHSGEGAPTVLSFGVRKYIVSHLIWVELTHTGAQPEFFLP